MSYYSRVHYSAGGAGTYAVPFPYISTTHVFVLDNGALYSGTVTWLSPSTVSLSPDVVGGHSVDIQRTTPLTPLVDFVAPVSAADMNTALLQALYVSQELSDLGLSGVGGPVAPGGAADWNTMTNKPAAITAIQSLTPAATKIAEYTSSTAAHMISTPSGGGGGAGSVNPGTGTNTRLIATIFADYANVNDYLSTGETTYDNAFARALADKGKVYVPSVPTLGGAFYPVTGPILPSTGQSIRGDGMGNSVITCTTTNMPVISLVGGFYWIDIVGLSLNHSGTAVAGGAGIHQGQALTDWIDDGLIEAIDCTANYVNFDLGKAFYCDLVDCNARSAIAENYKFLTTGNSTVGGGASAGGPLQWYLSGCASGSAGTDGYSWNVSGTGFGGAGVGSSVGTMLNCTSYNSGRYGVCAFGSAAQPINSMRIDRGFYGQDHQHGIYLDTYGRDHVIAPIFVELSGSGGSVGDNIRLTANNTNVSVQVCHCIGAFGDGINSASVNLNVCGGHFTNNGLAAGGSPTWSGIRTSGAGANISGCTFDNVGGSVYQQYGIWAAVDDMNVSGCRFISNTLAPIGNLPNPTVTSMTSNVSGCMPKTVNDSYLNTLHISGPSAISGGITLLGGATISGATSGITVANVYATSSMGIGTPATGTAGRLDVSSVFSNTLNLASTFTGTAISLSGDITSSTMHSGVVAFSGGVNITGVGLACSSFGATFANVTVGTSLGVGTPASGVGGQVDATTFKAGGTTIVAP